MALENAVRAHVLSATLRPGHFLGDVVDRRKILIAPILTRIGRRLANECHVVVAVLMRQVLHDHRGAGQRGGQCPGDHQQAVGHRVASSAPAASWLVTAMQSCCSRKFRPDARDAPRRPFRPRSVAGCTKLPIGEVGLQLAQVGVVADVVADAVGVRIADLADACRWPFRSCRCIRSRWRHSSRPPPRLYTSAGPRVLREIPEGIDHVVAVDLVADLLTLIAEDRVRSLVQAPPAPGN